MHHATRLNILCKETKSFQKQRNADFQNHTGLMMWKKKGK
ncbi:hypothetical protein DOT_2103 [Desulfosporosinus sp. OT]|nr:hypothetical protein DOT_2103 [Desulfosporosinus sp. OT]